jgi:hypothetical protein
LIPYEPRVAGRLLLSRRRTAESFGSRTNSGCGRRAVTGRRGPSPVRDRSMAGRPLGSAPGVGPWGPAPGVRPLAAPGRPLRPLGSRPLGSGPCGPWGQTWFRGRNGDRGAERGRSAYRPAIRIAPPARPVRLAPIGSADRWDGGMRRVRPPESSIIRRSHPSPSVTTRGTGSPGELQCDLHRSLGPDRVRRTNRLVLPNFSCDFVFFVVSVFRSARTAGRAGQDRSASARPVVMSRYCRTTPRSAFIRRLLARLLVASRDDSGLPGRSGSNRGSGAPTSRAAVA